MPIPRLTFFCELESEALQALLSEPVLADLRALKASLSLGLLDLSPERAKSVRRLNQAGIPVIAWLLLPKSQGYWFNLDNAPHAIERYKAFQAWTIEHNLKWDGVGLDIEPDIHEIGLWRNQKQRLLPEVAHRMLRRRRLAEAQAAYKALVNRIHADGYRVDSYILPFMVDERKTGATLLRRTLGLVDLATDREVMMLYTSQLRPHGVGLLASYAPQAQSVGIGVTGGGVEIEGVSSSPLNWEEFSRDLRLAWYWCNDLHIFSLEGCVRQGFLNRLKTFAWDQPILLPEVNLRQVNGWRDSLQLLLWLSAHMIPLLVGFSVTWVLTSQIRRLWKKRKK
jgi:hypothetical protein